MKENKPGYKHTALGWIPKDWDIKKIGTISKVTAGATPSTVNKSFWGGDIRWMNSGELNQKKVYEVSGRITKEGLNNSSTRILPVNCILVGLAGQGKTRGTVAINKVELCTNQSIAAIYPCKEFSEEYLFYNLDARYKELRKLSTGDGGRGGLNLQLISSLLVACPPLSEQKAIVKVLSTWDKAIEKTQELIAQKELRKKYLMQQLLTGKKRLKGFKGEWKEIVLGNLFNERNEIGYNNLPLLSVGAAGIYPQSDSIKKDTSNEDKSKYKRIMAGDIGYNTMRMWQGRSALSTLEGIVSPAYTVVVPKEYANASFFIYLFVLPRVVYSFFTHSQGLVDDTLNCKYHDFATVKVFVPNIDEQTAIANILQKADEEIALQKQKLEALKEQKKGLMQVLLTGKERIKT